MQPTLQVEITFVAVRDPRRTVVGTVGAAAVQPGGRRRRPPLRRRACSATRPARASTPPPRRARSSRASGTCSTQAGCAWADVRDALVYVTRPQLGAVVLAELARACPLGLPAGIVVQTELVVPDATVEIMVTASPGSAGG